MLCCRAVLPGMVARRRGRIVNAPGENDPKKLDLDDTLIRAYAQPDEAWRRLLHVFAAHLDAIAEIFVRHKRGEAPAGPDAPPLHELAAILAPVHENGRGG